MHRMLKSGLSIALQNTAMDKFKVIMLSLVFLLNGFLFSASAGNGNDESSQNTESKTSKKQEKLNGKVRSIKYILAGFGENPNNTTYNFDKEQNLSEKLTFNKNILVSKETYKEGLPINSENYHELGYVTERTSRKFDKNGNLVELKKFNTYKQLLHEEKIKYDKMGNKVQHLINGNPSNFSYTYNGDQKMVEIMEFDDNKNLLKMDVYWYNEEGLKTKWGRYNSSGTNIYKVIYTYNEDGKVTEQNNFNGAKELEYQKQIEYNVNGEIVKIIELDGQGQVQYQIDYEYRNNLMSKKVEYFQDGTRTEYLFDEKNGNMSELVFFNSENEVDHSEKFEYNYDDNNNWVRKTRVYNNVEEIIVRSLEYY